MIFKNKKENSQEIEFQIKKLENRIESTKINHILHLILTILTVGFWSLIWIFVGIWSYFEKMSYESDLKKIFQKKESLLQEKDELNLSKIDNTEKIIKLAELKEKGLISPEEFEIQKNICLNKI